MTTSIPTPSNVESERERVCQILAIGNRFPAVRDEVDAAVESGMPLDDFRRRALAMVEAEQRARSSGPVLYTPYYATRSLGRNEPYRLADALKPLLEDKPLPGMIAEMSRHLESLPGNRRRQERSLLVPIEVILGTRAAVSKAGSGGNLVGTVHMDDEYEPHLMSDLALVSAGARVLPGLIGDVDIPKGDAFGEPYWVDEGADVGEPAVSFASVEMAPHTVGGLVIFTRRMRLQSQPFIEQILRDTLQTRLFEALERAALTGTGADGQPLGLLGHTLPTAPFAASGLRVSDFLSMWGAVKEARGSTSRLGYLTDFPVAAAALSTPKTAGDAAMIAERSDDGEMTLAGFPLFATQELGLSGSPATHQVVFGDWSKLIIGIWGSGIELVLDESTLSASGGRRIIALFDVDVAVTQPEAFSVASNVVPIA